MMRTKASLSSSTVDDELKECRARDPRVRVHPHHPSSVEKISNPLHQACGVASEVSILPMSKCPPQRVTPTFPKTPHKVALRMTMEIQVQLEDPGFPHKCNACHREHVLTTRPAPPNDRYLSTRAATNSLLPLQLPKALARASPTGKVTAKTAWETGQNFQQSC